MFRTYFGIEENPFSNTPDPHYLYMSERHQEALAHLQYGVQGSSGFVLLTGEVGTGKTTICRCLVEQLPDNIDLALCLNPRLSEAELLATICDELGIDTSDCHADSVKDHMDVLNKHLLDGHAKGRRAVLIIDEAQNLGVKLLEQVRLLTNLETASTKLLQVILIGQSELRDLVGKAELRQLSQRITARYHLEPMNRTEAKNYIRHRLQVGGLAADLFQPGALQEVYAHSSGIPRLINSICERSLLGAYAAGTKSIDARLVHTAAGEVMGKPALPPRQKTVVFGLMAGGAAAAVIAGILFTGSLDTDATLAPKPSQPVTGTHEEVLTSPVMAARLDDTPKGKGTTPAPGSPPATAPTAGVAETPAALDRAPPDREAPKDKAVPHTADEEAEVFSRLIAEGAVVVSKAAAKETAVASKAAARETVVASRAPAGDAPPPRQKAVSPAVDEAVTLENLFRHPAIKGGLDTAAARLFALWNRELGTFSGLDPCADAEKVGLRCFQRHGNWSKVENTNRPTLIGLVNEKGARRYAVVSALNGPKVTLDIDGLEIITDAGAIQPLWSGDFLVLWEPLSDIRRNLRAGMKGRDVAWLRGRLAEILGQPADLDKAAVFDAGLRSQVVAFQKIRGLKGDGIVGILTQIQLGAEVGGSSVPVLRNRP